MNEGTQHHKLEVLAVMTMIHDVVVARCSEWGGRVYCTRSFRV